MKQDQEGKMESEEEGGSSEAGEASEEGEEVEDIYHTAMDEAGKEENAETIREKDKSSRANLEEGRSQSETKKGLTGRNSTGAHYTDDVMRQNDGDKSKARQAGTN